MSRDRQRRGRPGRSKRGRRKEAARRAFPGATAKHAPRREGRSEPESIAARNALLLKMLRALSLGALAAALFSLAAAALAAERDSLDLTELSLEDLMTLEVTSVSRRAEPMSDAPAAAFVVTGEEIRRSGAISIPDALRFVPGVQVARISSSWWAVTARGFAGSFSNKLLVLIDGRSVYTPFYAGVYWDAQDVLLEDIDRIEVIRGPGATLWGANAVNGVINIITKDAANTAGFSGSGAVGTREEGSAASRYGFSLSDDASLRLYAKYADRAEFVDPTGAGMRDPWTLLQGGFRLDWKPAEGRHVTLQGDLGGRDAAFVYSFPIVTAPYHLDVADTSRFSGGDVLMRWSEDFSPRSDLSLQAYFDRTDRNNIRFSEKHDVIDLDLQHRWSPSDRIEFVWGAGYRSTADKVDSVRGGYTIPGRRTVGLLSGFAQADLGAFDRKLHFTVGSKFEHNDYTGFEAQPNARVCWLPSKRQTLWAAISRAVRTPSRIESDGSLDWEVVPPGEQGNTTAYPVLMTFVGSPDFKSEALTAYETGYRVRASEHLALDLAAFYNRYEDVRTVLLEKTDYGYGESPTPSWIILQYRAANGAEAQSYGAEVAADWRPFRSARFELGYSFLRIDLRIAHPETEREVEAAEDSSPRHQAFGRASFDLPGRVLLDLGVRFVDELPRTDVGRYVTLDARVAWSPFDHSEFFLAGSNLTEKRHVEFYPGIGDQIASVQRSVYGGLAIRY